MFTIVVGAIGATYASVPLYKVFCQRTGFGGTTQRVSNDILDSDVDQNDEPNNNALESDDSDNGVSKISDKLMKKLYAMSNQNPSPGHGATWTDADAASRLRDMKPVPGGRVLTIDFDSNVSATTPLHFKPATRNVKVVAGETALAFFTTVNRTNKPISAIATYNVFPAKAGLYFNKVQCFCFEEQRIQGNEEVDMPVLFFIDPKFYDDPQLKWCNEITLSYTFFKSNEQFDGDDDDDDDDEEDNGEKRS